MAVLRATNLSKSFGGLKAVKDFSLALEAGELVGLIGPNGAGKTTVFNLLTGIYRPDAGTILVSGNELSSARPERIVMEGVTRTFQSVRIFAKLTVLDNLRTACFPLASYGLLEGLFGLPAYRKQEGWADRYIEELMERFQIGEYAESVAGELPYVIQRRLELARAMATRPKVLLLDEPTAGMNMDESHEYFHIVQGLIERENIAVLLIEHAIQLVMDLCKRIIVMDYGSVIAEGAALEIQNNERVIEAYLGMKHDA